LRAGTNTITIWNPANSWGPHWDYIDISTAFTGLPAPSVTLTRHSGTTSSSIYGDSLSFDVSVTGSPTPTGSVTLKDGGSNGITVGSGTLAGGACAITTTALTSGSHPNIVAVYAGDSHYASATSSALSAQTVGKATPVVTVTGTTSFTYNGSPQGPSNATTGGSTGTLSYNYAGSGGTSYGPNNTRPVGIGSYTVTATVAADANYNSASSGATAFTIAKATPVVTVTVGSYTYNGFPQGPDTATTGGSTGNVTYNYAGSGGTSYPASATKPTDAGSYAVTATVAADSNFNSASSSATAFTIAKATPSLSVTNSPVIYNGSAQAAAVSGSVAGTVSSVKYNGLATVPSAVATYAVTADFAPTDSANYNVLTGASAGNFVISPPPTTTAGTAMASAAGQSGITVTMPYTDDGNANNTYTVEYKFSFGSTWVAWVSNAAHVVSPYTTTITGLTPATSYDIRVTYNDADGLTGTNPQTITGVTTSNPTVATLDAWTNVSSTAPGNASGTVNVTGQTVSGGSNRLLVVAVCMEANGTPVTMTASATFGGKALTAIGSSLTTGREFCYMGYLKDVDIPSAASTLAVTYGCTGTSRTISGLHIKWASHANVDQATPVHDSNANFNGAANVTFGAQIDYLNRGLVFYAAANGGTPTTMTAPTDFSAVYAAAASTNAHTSYVGTTASRTSSGNYASTVSVAFNGTTSTRSALVVASLRPARATPAVWVTNSATYNGSAQAATVTGSVAGTVSNVKYNGSATVPTAAGTFAVTADFTPGDTTSYSSLTGAPAGSFVIQKAGASVTLGNLAQTYDGTPKPATAATIPPGLTVDLTYNGSATPPTAIGSYTVEATVNEPNHTGTATGTLVISEAAVVTWRKVHFTTEEIAAGLAADDADPDGDGATNLAEFAFNGGPRNGASTGMFFTRLADDSLTYTCAVRRGTVFAAGAGQARKSLSNDGLVYTIEGTDSLSGSWDGVITDQGTSDTAPAGSGLSDLTGSGWQYHTFSAFNGLAGKGFLRARVETSP